MASALLFLLLALSMLAYISYPLLRRSQRNTEYVFDENKIELAAERERIYSELEDLDFEHECGKISDEDYQLLRRELLSKIELDSPEPKTTKPAQQLKDSVEEEIAKYKAQRQL